MLAVFSSFLRRCQRLQPKPLTRLMSQSPAVPVKPPNVLVLQPSPSKAKEKEGRVSSLKEGLALCLNQERYVLYNLGVEDVLHTPWRENCTLLVVPSSVMVARSPTEEGESSDSNWPKVLREIAFYVHSGGVLLSMQSALNALLGFKPPDLLVQNRLSLVTTQLKSTSSGDNIQFRTLTISPVNCGSDLIENETRPPLSVDDVAFIVSDSSETSLPSSSWPQALNSSVDTIDNATADMVIKSDYNSQQLSCVRKMKFEGGGRAILSYIELLPEIHENLDVGALVQVKKGAEDRAKFLKSVLSGIGLECSVEEVPKLSHTYLFCSEENHSQYLSTMIPLQTTEGIIKGTEMDIQLIPLDFSKLGTPVDPLPEPSAKNLTVVARPARWQLHSLPFNPDLYFEHLMTAQLGRTVLYTPVISSTQTVFTGNMTFCNALTPRLGVVCVAAQQTQGKGRSGNVWISPRGSMMFSTVLKIHPSSRLYQKMPLLQHIVALSVVSAIRTISGYEDVPVGIKWPNDIYYRDRVKLGGILVSCFSFGSDTTLTAVIGCGVNISNKYPTMSVNDCIALYNSENSRHLPPLTIEHVLARTLNMLELYLGQYEATEMRAVEKHYYHYWLHSGATVKLASRGHEEVTIVGIDEYGYLKVSCKNGQELSLQPDGNTFDIMNGLIAMK